MDTHSYCSGARHHLFSLLSEMTVLCGHSVQNEQSLSTEGVVEEASQIQAHKEGSPSSPLKIENPRSLLPGTRCCFVRRPYLQLKFDHLRKKKRR